MTEKTLMPIHPGEILLEDFMKPLEINCSQLARGIDVPSNRVSEIVAGRRAITADTALRLAKYFGTSAEIWLGLQKDYDLRLARMDTWPQIADRVRVFKEAA